MTLSVTTVLLASSYPVIQLIHVMMNKGVGKNQKLHPALWKRGASWRIPWNASRIQTMPLEILQLLGMGVALAESRTPRTSVQSSADTPESERTPSGFNLPRSPKSPGRSAVECWVTSHWVTELYSDSRNKSIPAVWTADWSSSQCQQLIHPRAVEQDQHRIHRLTWENSLTRLFQWLYGAVFTELRGRTMICRALLVVSVAFSWDWIRQLGWGWRRVDTTDLSVWPRHSQLEYHSKSSGMSAQAT